MQNIIKSVYQMKKVIDLIDSNRVLSYDIETTGLNPRKDTVIGFGISNADEGYYIVHKHWNVEKEQFDEYVSLQDCATLLKRLQGKKLTAWNFSFDGRFTYHYFGVDLIESIWSEGMLAKHTVDEDRPFGLKEVAARIFGDDAKAEQEAMKDSIAKNGGGPTDFYKADLDLMALYCVQDCKLTYKLNEYYLDLIKQEKLEKFYFDDEVMPLYKYVTIPMELKGIPLNMPLLEATRAACGKAIDELEDSIQIMIKPYLANFELWFLDKEYPVSRSPANPFVQALAQELQIDLPKTKSGKYSLTAKNLDALPDCLFKQFITTDIYLPEELMRKVQRSLFEGKYMFNLSSKHHLKKLFFEELNLKAISFTDNGAPQVDDLFLSTIKNDFEFVSLLLDYNRLVKLKGTYFDRFFDQQEDGIFYPRFMQHATISGRYGSDLQQLPRPLESGQASDVVLKFNNEVRKLFISGPGYKFLDTDYNSLEPHVFAHVSGDDGLKDIFKNGWDFYSTIAIKTEKLNQYSPDKNADNYLGKLNKALRQKSKAYCLGVPYGMSDYKLQFELNVSQKEAAKLIDDYLSAFPQLKEWMQKSEDIVKKYGRSYSQGGRVRHMPLARVYANKYGDSIKDSLQLWKEYNTNPGKYKQMKEIRKSYINMLNNAKNFQIQSLSASIVNRACIKIAKELKRLGIKGYICAQVHDQVIVRIEEGKASEFAPIKQNIMENTYKLSIPLKAPVAIGENFYEAH